jgi:hypothetical protein
LPDDIPQSDVSLQSAPTRRFETPGRDLPQRTGARRVMAETIHFMTVTGLLYKIAHSWLDPVVNPVQTALGCPP